MGRSIQWARSIQPKFPEISVQNSIDRFGPTGKVSKKTGPPFEVVLFFPVGAVGILVEWIVPSGFVSGRNLKIRLDHGEEPLPHDWAHNGLVSP